MSNDDRTLREQLSDKIFVEYYAYIAKIVKLTPREIIARADVIADFQFVLSMTKDTDFNPPDELIEHLLNVDGVLDEIREKYLDEQDDDNRKHDFCEAMWQAAGLSAENSWDVEPNDEAEDDLEI